jgi:hypothetical protein
MHTNKKEIWKYCYWLDDSGLSQLKKQMEEKGTTMVQAEKNQKTMPCW